MEIFGIRTEGLGDSTYLLVHEGVGVLVDPQRDVERFLAPLEETGADLRFVLETHLHNDYVSGGRDAARRTGAELVLPAAAAPAFRHTPAFHMEDLDGGPLTIRPIHTPGHTPEHTSYLVLIEGRPVALFSGGSLLVGAAGRPDLLGPERADTLARLQYRSVHRLAALPDDVGLYPTHGEGSFCTASGAGRTTSTIGQEKATNPVLAYPDEDSFVEAQLGALQPYPRYYRYMGPANLYGPEPLPDAAVPTLSVDRLSEVNATVVDMRPRAAYAASHLRGSLGVELRHDFGTWVGWLVDDIRTPIVLVAEPGQDVEEAVVQLNRIGIDEIVGVVTDLTTSPDLASFRTVTVAEVADALARGEQVVDVRAPVEWETLHLPGTIHAYVPDLADGIPSGIDPTRPAWLVCATGYRATIAASLLERHGVEPVVLTDGGVEDVARLAEAPLPG